jgi:hypothetical protein
MPRRWASPPVISPSNASSKPVAHRAQQDHRHQRDADADHREQGAGGLAQDVAQYGPADVPVPVDRAAFGAHRFGGREPRRAPRGQPAADEAQSQRDDEALHDQSGRELRRHNAADRRGVFYGAHGRQSQQQPDAAAEQAEHQRFAEDHPQYPARPPADGAQHADLFGALEDAHQHRVHHAHTADDDGDQGNRPREDVDILEHVLLIGEVRRCCGGELAEAALDAVAQGVEVGPVAHFEEQRVDLARFAVDALRFFQQHNRGAILKRLAGFVNPHDLVAAFVKAEGVTHTLFKVIGGGASQKQRLSALAGRSVRERFSVYDLEVLDGKAGGIVTVDNEVRRGVGGGEGVDHLRDVGDARHTGQGWTDILIDGAEHNVQRVILHHQQIGSAAARHRAVPLDEAIGQRAQRHHRRHPHRDAEHGEQRAHFASEQVFENHGFCTRSERWTQIFADARRFCRFAYFNLRKSGKSASIVRNYSAVYPRIVTLSGVKREGSWRCKSRDSRRCR